MSQDLPHRFAARMANLSEALAMLARECEAQGVATEDVLRLSLVVEELFTNTVQHGHGGDCDEPVCMGWHAEPQHLVLRYADRAPAFDPRPQALAPLHPDDTESGDVLQRPVGRLGLVLVGQLSQSLDYAREEGWNTLRLRLRRGG